MGTRINILMPHRLPEWSDRVRVLRLLSTALPAARAVEAYFATGNPQPSSVGDWTAEPTFPPPETRDYQRYTGPGPLFVDINPYAVHVRTGARWRGFLSIQPLRHVCLDAFLAIAATFDARSARCFPDNDFVCDAFWGGEDFGRCCAILNRQFGPAVPLDEAVDANIASLACNGCPAIQCSLSLEKTASNRIFGSGG